MRYLMSLLFSIMMLVACGGPQPSSTPDTPSPATDSAAQQDSHEPNFPAEADYSIIDSSAKPGIKRSLNVRLKDKVSEETLRAIAFKLKDQDPGRYDRTFITYYLPGMTVGTGAWATTHFTPDLKVQILGLTAEEEEIFVSEATPVDREVVGRWIIEGALGRTITIYQEAGKLYLEEVYKKFGTRLEEMVESETPRGRRFETIEGSDAGDHYLLTSAGDLEVRDNEGLISTGKKVD